LQHLAGAECRIYLAGINKKKMKDTITTDSANIPYKVLKALSKRYKKEKKSKLNPGLGKEDTNAIFFENNIILKEICQKIIDNKASGIRFYLGAYDKKVVNEAGTGVMLPHDPRYVKQVTLAFVTTIKDSSGNDVDDTSDEKNVFILSPVNNGKLCPPDTGCEI
jgi:hypothetical protein